MKSTRPALEIPREPLTYPLRRAARLWPDRCAVVEPESGGRTWTFAELEAHSSALAAALAELGAAPGDRVGLWMKNSAAYILAFYGILKAGGVVVPISTHYGEREARHQLGITAAKGLIADQTCLAQAPGLGPGSLDLRFLAVQGAGQPGPGLHSLAALLDHPGALDRSSELDPAQALAVLPFSSGTTGLPKGVMLTHANLLANLHQVVQAHEVRQEDVFLNQLPFFHIYGMTVLMGQAILAGARQVVVSRFRPVEEFLNLIAAHCPTVLFTVPLILQEFCQHPRVPAMNWGHLRYVNSGGAPLGAELQKAFTRLTGVPVIQGYGLTESSPTTHANPLGAIKPGSIGTAVALTEDRIVDPATGDEAASGQVGELWVRGPQVMQGYYQDPASTARALVEGWLRTGDLARQDEEGYVFVVDRLKELIKCKGFQVAPAELEAVLLTHPRVLDAAVIGEPHPGLGEAPVAYVVPRPGQALTPEELVEFAAQGMAKYKRLARVIFTEAIPRSASGKILRRVLKEAHQPAA